MNQAILKILDEMNENNKKSSDYFNDKLAGPVREAILNEIKSEISSLPSDTQWIESLQRYVDEGGIFKDDEGDYVKYEDVLKLLK